MAAVQKRSIAASNPHDFNGFGARSRTAKRSLGCTDEKEKVEGQECRMAESCDTWQTKLLPHPPWLLVNDGGGEGKRRKEAPPCAEAPSHGRCSGARSVAVGEGMEVACGGQKSQALNVAMESGLLNPPPPHKKKGEDNCKGVSSYI